MWPVSLCFHVKARLQKTPGNISRTFPRLSASNCKLSGGSQLPHLCGLLYQLWRTI